ncbi:39S ribosomal protein L47, mitochondrial [Synchiropus splendidus]|uniref:39S ribosomal protein L47, mitochondrial n=1 Tax=Synchiropus splendidus TaxID=270530 RepID=UPI00237E741F|nr:39S ribosomal protein L47, mitochondrial [Synchiropus splendidus]
MASFSSGGRALTLCKYLKNACTISLNARKCVSNVSKFQPQIYSLHKTVAPPYSPTSSQGQCRSVYTTVCRRGLDEFFDASENWGESTVKSGAPWTAKLLRAKSNEDLHKLWYVLLKEKNMLLTLEQEAKRSRVQMPSPERLRKVERSMIRLDTVVKERETALRLLQTGQEKARPGAWRRSVFGYVYWYRFREHAIPWYMNRRYKRKRFYTPKFVEPYIRLRIEKSMKANYRKERREREALAKLKEKFPHMKVPAS